jgi:hypothetical protein
MSDNETKVKITGDASGAEAAMAKAAVAVSSGATTMKESFNALTGIFDTLQSKMILVAGVLAGGKAFKESIDKVVDLTKEATQLSNALGISANEANVLNTALGNVFLDKDTYIDATKQITKQLNSNATSFQQMGIATKDAQGKLLPMEAIIANTANSLQQYKAGVDRNVMANQLLGRSYDDVLKLAKLTPEVMKDAAQEVQDYHKQLDPSVVLKYRQAMENVGDVLEGLQVALGKAVIPVFTSLGEWFSSVGPSVVNTFIAVLDSAAVVFGIIADVVKSLWETCSDVFEKISEGVTMAFGESSISKTEFFGNCLKVVELAFLALGFGIEGFVEAVKTYLDVASTYIFAFANAATHALSGDFSGAKKAWDYGLGQIDSVIEKHADNMIKLQEKYAGKANEIIMPTLKEGAPTDKQPSGGSKESFTIDKKKEGGSEKTRTGEWANEIANQRETYEITNNLRKMDLQEEINYWQQKLALTNGSGKEYQEVLKKLNDAKLKQLEDSSKHSAALAAVEIDRMKAASNAQLAIDEDNAKAQLDLGQINNDQYLALEEGFEQRRYDIAKVAMQQRMELASKDPNQSPEERAQILAQMEALEADHARRVNQINIEKTKESGKLFSDLSDSMSGLWDKGIESMMNGTFKWSNAYKAVLAEVGKVFVKFAAEKAKAWLQTEVLQTAYTKIQTVIRSVLTKAGLITDTTATTAAAGVKIGAEAAAAGAGAAASQAAIPVIGPGLALAAMAATMAAVIGLKGSIKSARNGYDIPAGINPMVQLHESEMVLPKAQADAVRGMAEGGGGMGGGITINVHAIDAAGVKKFLMDNSYHVAEAVKKQFRNGGSVPA